MVKQQRKGDGVGHGNEVRVNGNGQNIQGKQSGKGKSVCPESFAIVIQSCQKEKLGRHGGMAEHPLPQNRAEYKQQVSHKWAGYTLAEQPQQPGAKCPLCHQAKQSKPAEILESIRQNRRKQPEQGGQQGNRVGICHAETLRSVDVGGNTQGKRKTALPVKQPAGIMLLDVFLYVPAPTESVVGHIQGAKPKYQKKSDRPQCGTT